MYRGPAGPNEVSNRYPALMSSERTAMLGPETRATTVGPSSQAGSVIVSTDQKGKIQFSGGISQCGTIAPPKIEKEGWESAARRICTSQSGLGKASSSVITTRSPVTLSKPAFRAALFPNVGSKI